MHELMNFILLHLPWFWLAVMILCLIFEALTFSLTTVWAALSALILIFLSWSSLPLRWQFLFFFLITIVLLVFTRPFAVKKLKLGRVMTNINSIDGQEVIVVKKISKFEKGEVKSSNGVLWSAMGQGDSEISKGATCRVVQVKGNTLVVKKIEDVD
ncbi:MAG: NfeD family protein [Treponema sp.]|nr:NfeD family protein [Treponema sp.]